MKSNMTKIVNLFGGPGIGKSSIASGMTYKLKKRHISCDNPYEFPKLLAWDDNKSAIKDQLYVLANQHRGITKSYGKVDYIIVDSPILLSVVYKDYYQDNEYPSNLYQESFDNFIVELFKKYDSINILLKRTDGLHNNKERYQSLDESKGLDVKIESILNKWDIPYLEVEVGDDTVNRIVDLIL
jgi:deoxyadenosine/deoxycytidine kinase